MLQSASSPANPITSLMAVVVLVVLALLVPGTPAEAGQGSGPTTAITGYIDSTPPPPLFTQGCTPAGGATIADPDTSAEPADSFVLVGGGWGHGAGMSQYGAQGAARLGCSAAQILTTYFPGTAVSTVPTPPIIIGLSSSITSTTVTAEGDTVTWELCHYITGACQDLPVQQGTGSAWTVSILGNATYRITDGATTVFEGGDFELNLRAKLSTTDAENRRLAVSTTGHTYRWGVLQIDSVQRSTSDAFLTLHIPDMEKYLRGLAEVPASWPVEALKAQAIAGRSYAVRRIELLGVRDSCRCNLLATPQDQNYEGYDYELADARGGGSFRTAVDQSAGQVLTFGDEIAETFYSSSHGGHSESTAFVFGGALAYAQPVDDSRWDLASSNPLRRWTRSFTAAELGAAAGVGQATGIRVLEPTGAAGRVGRPDRGFGGVEVTGSAGTAVLSGDQMKSALQLRSTLFGVDTLLRDGQAPVEPQPEPTPDPQPEPEPEPDPNVPDLLDRAAAADRISTAVAVSGHGWDASSDVILAAADRFPDALAGVKLAASLDAPLLLSDSVNLSPQVAEELERLGATTVWLLGGTAALGSEVRGDLADLGVITRRLSGADRFETAGEIATAATMTAEHVTVALGTDWPDAVSASSLAALVDGPPTLLVSRASVPDATVQALRDLGTTEVTVVGGSAVISEQVVDQLEELGMTVARISGSNRFETSAAVALEAIEQRTGQVPLVLASGSGFADALSAGALAARVGGVLLLAPRDTLEATPSLSSFVDAQLGRLDGGVVVGGTGVISLRVEQGVESLLDR